MAIEKDIDRDFHNAEGEAILFLGRYTSLSIEEIKLFLEKFNIRYTDRLDDDVVMVVESTILSPIEEEIATQAYQNKIPLYNTDQFDRLYADKLNSDSILMSLKLSNNQERLARLLHNRYLSDALFIKLFAMYDWGDEGMFDNSENMKIATLFAKRFFSKNRFDAATYHSPISVFEVAIITKNPDLLEVMYDLPTIEVKQSRNAPKRPRNTKEAIAANAFANEKTLTKLFRRNDPGIDYFLARNPATTHALQEQIFERGDDQTKEALSQNENLSPLLFEKLTHIPSLWEFQPVDMEKLSHLPTPIPPQIGENEQLSPEVIDFLLQQEDVALLENLAQNPTLNAKQLQALYDRGERALYPAIASNPNTPAKILHTLFAEHDPAIDRFLALNTQAPQAILEQLFARDDFEINCSLALNEALPIAWLQQLQIDARLLPYLKENSTFTENILHNLGI
jgi:hypothetical protein